MNEDSRNVEYIRALRERRVYKIVARQRAAQGPLDPAEHEQNERLGIKEWHTRGYLPHFDKPGVMQMVNFRLADGLPAARRHEWESLLNIEDKREKRLKIEEYLDLGYGECYLKEPHIAKLVEEAFLHGDGKRYRLVAWVVMPNHAHVLIEQWESTLPGIVQSWKSYTGRMANRWLRRKGELWQKDYWDRYVRDREHFGRVLRYIENNPVKAGLVAEAAAWPYSSANPIWKWETDGRFTRYHGAQLIRTKAETDGK